MGYNLAASLLSAIIAKKRRGVEYQLYPLDHKSGSETIQRRERGLLKSHIITLLYELNILQTKNQKLSINYKIMEALNQILALPSIKLMVNRKRMKGVIHVNIILQDDVNTIHRNSEITREEYELDFDMLNELVIKFREKTVDTIDFPSSSHCAMAVPHPHSCLGWSRRGTCCCVSVGTGGRVWWS